MAEGGGLLNRYRVVKPYRGFESLRLRQNHNNALISLIFIFKAASCVETRAEGGAMTDPLNNRPQDFLNLNKAIRAGVGALPVVGSPLVEFLAFAIGAPRTRAPR